ncbi:MAG: hypothetical protein AB1730_24290 [Myxococcota bacterium]|jgi:hypothetical protein
MTSARKALQLLPPCATTGIGSLPHSQGELALQMALQQDVPYLPQLPAGSPSELMIPAALDGVPGLTLDAEGTCTIDLEVWRKSRDRFTARIEDALASGQLAAFEPSMEACRSFRPFLYEVETRKLPFAKVQLAGPATVRWVARTHEGTPTSEVPELDQQLFRLSLAKTLALVKAVRRAGATPILYLDEPGLYALERGNVRHLVVMKELQMLVVALQREGALVGLHCCSNTDWAQVLDLGLDLLSLDARLSLDAVLEERDAWLRFLASGATLSLGIVPTDLASTWELGELCESVEASLRATTPASLSFEGLLSRVLLTPACGLAMRSVLDAERITGQVREAQKRFLALAAPRA